MRVHQWSDACRSNVLYNVQMGASKQSQSKSEATSKPASWSILIPSANGSRRFSRWYSRGSKGNCCPMTARSFSACAKWFATKKYRPDYQIGMISHASHLCVETVWEVYATELAGVPRAGSQACNKSALQPIASGSLCNEPEAG